MQNLALILSFLRFRKKLSAKMKERQVTFFSVFVDTCNSVKSETKMTIKIKKTKQLQPLKKENGTTKFVRSFFFHSFMGNQTFIRYNKNSKHGFCRIRKEKLNIKTNLQKFLDLPKFFFYFSMHIMHGFIVLMPIKI